MGECVVQRSVEGVRQQEILLCFPIYLFIYTAFGNAGRQVAASPLRQQKVCAAFSPF